MRFWTLSATLSLGKSRDKVGQSQGFLRNAFSTEEAGCLTLRSFKNLETNCPSHPSASSIFWQLLMSSGHTVTPTALSEGPGASHRRSGVYSADMEDHAMVATSLTSCVSKGCYHLLGLRTTGKWRILKSTWKGYNLASLSALGSIAYFTAWKWKLVSTFGVQNSILSPEGSLSVAYSDAF